MATPHHPPLHSTELWPLSIPTGAESDRRVSFTLSRGRTPNGTPHLKHIPMRPLPGPITPLPCMGTCMPSRGGHFFVFRKLLVRGRVRDRRSRGQFDPPVTGYVVRGRFAVSACRKRLFANSPSSLRIEDLILEKRGRMNSCAET